jgi:hypothetical protein
MQAGMWIELYVGSVIGQMNWKKFARSEAAHPVYPT